MTTKTTKTTKTTAKTTATPKQTAAKPKPSAVKPDYVVIGDRMVVTVQPSEFTDGGEFSLNLEPTLNMFIKMGEVAEQDGGTSLDEFVSMLNVFGSKNAVQVGGDLAISKFMPVMEAYYEEIAKRQGANAGE